MDDVSLDEMIRVLNVMEAIRRPGQEENNQED